MEWAFHRHTFTLLPDATELLHLTSDLRLSWFIRTETGWSCLLSDVMMTGI